MDSGSRCNTNIGAIQPGAIHTDSGSRWGVEKAFSQMQGFPLLNCSAVTIREFQRMLSDVAAFLVRFSANLSLEERG